ncbi:MAG: type II toxin-antitoxin system PemK/MazF family toxin [Chloroflexi bacterium]|nr:type II toxin-antitoxin system PemK/MazF family toxin [Chloroflexota bacterium]MBI3742633.1 type II toxin-antitoxin system PemK/MazF family toxin [Chloroflexota bacterium]
MPSTTIYRGGDLVLVDFPFATGQDTRRRPAMIVLDTGDADVIVARVTSQARQDDFDVPISEWRGAGLLLPSIVRLHKLATLEKSLIVRRLGSLQKSDREDVKKILGNISKDW